MFEFSEIETDTQKEIDGVWRPYKDGSELLIARIGNEKYRSLLRRKVKSNRAVLDNEDDLADKVGEAVVLEAISSTILLGWKGINVNGAEYPYTPENALKLLKASREFREAVRNYADDAEAYRKKTEGEAVKA